jgi:O-succinylbenzoic acid--CoA ligase
VVADQPLAGEEVEIDGRLDPEAVHTVLFTSGTTGAAKPVTLTYANHRASALATAWSLGVSPDDRWLCVLPLFHVGGLAILMRSAIYRTAAIIHPRFDPAATLESLESGEATLVSLVPTQLRRLLDGGLGERETPALRAILLGGGPMPRELLADAVERGLPVHQSYGMTETASQVASLPATEALDGGPSAGRLLPGVAAITDPASGEILLRGPMVSREALDADGWLHTGDRGRLDEDRLLQVEGRLDDVIVTGGENVAAAEVERALLEHPAVAEAAVVGEPDPDWGERVVAYVVPAPGAGPPEDSELASHCRARIAPYKVPKAVHVVDALPLTALGKVERHALGRPAAGRVPG